MDQFATQLTFARNTVICAADMLIALGHSGFAKLLLELDLPYAEIGQGSGLMQRATSLAEFAVKNPTYVTSEQ